MANSLTLYLPLSTTVVIQSFVNAAYMQQVIMQPEVGSSIAFLGQGYYDTPIGTTVFVTPDSSQSSQGFAITVSVNHSTDGGRSWQPSEVAWTPCEIMYYNLLLVASEDITTNNTWDDCTTYFTWGTPPTSSQTRKAKQLKRMKEHEHKNIS